MSRFLMIFVLAMGFALAAQAQQEQRKRVRPRPAAQRPKPRPAPPAEAAPEYRLAPSYQLAGLRLQEPTLFQPLAGSFVIFAGVTDLQMKAGGENLDQTVEIDIKSQQTSFMTAFLYGLSEDWALGIESLSYSQQSTKISGTAMGFEIPDSNTKLEGMDDLALGVRGRFESDGITLHLGGQWSTSLEEAKSGDSENKGNRASGGMAVTPYIGVSAPAGPGFIGGQANYTLHDTRKIKPADGGPTETETGGNAWILRGFYEMQFEEFVLTPAMSFSQSEGTTTKVAGSEDDKGTGSRTQILELGLGYRPIPAAFIGLRGAYTVLDVESDPDSETEIDYEPAFVFALQGRFEF